MDQGLGVSRRGSAHGRELRGKRVLVLGLARQGLALARFLLEQGAQVTVTDLQTEDALRESLHQLEGLPIRYAFGGHPLGLLDHTDLVCLSGGVPPDVPIVKEAQRRGISLSNDAQLTLEYSQATVIGITGSSGKTTTTTLTGLMLREAGVPALVGGNIGTPLIDRVQDLDENDWAVMELSSFQLELCDRSPDVAAVTNITPNHLDRHGTMEAYTKAKANILRWQHQDDVCVLSADNAVTGRWLRHGQVDGIAGNIPDGEFAIPAKRLGFSVLQELVEGAFLSQGTLTLRIRERGTEKVCALSDLRLRGIHNVANVLAACVLAAEAGAQTGAMSTVATTFHGVPHRLEEIRDLGGVLWINDSIATSPERSMAGIRSFRQPLVLLAGGRDKHLPWDEWASLVLERARTAVLFGEAAELVHQALQRAECTVPETSGAASCEVVQCSDLGNAVQAAHLRARPGDVVLLSPGCASFDAYRDFAERGDHYRRLVNELGECMC